MQNILGGRRTVLLLSSYSTILNESLQSMLGDRTALHIDIEGKGEVVLLTAYKSLQQRLAANPCERENGH